MRLDKYLSEMGAGTRSELKKAVRAGRVTVNGVKVKDAAMHVEKDDVICMDGERVAYEQFVYYLMNKPAGVISATEDTRDRTVLDLLEGQQRKDLFPVGRLDRDTEGLLLITNDGELAHRLLSPRNHVDKVYFARLDAPVGETERRLFAEGLRVDETLTAMPAGLEIQQVANQSEVVKAPKFERPAFVNNNEDTMIMYFTSGTMGPLALDGSLPPGAYRRLTEEEESAIIGL